MKSNSCGCSSMAEQKLPKLLHAALFRHPRVKTPPLSLACASASLKTDVPVPSCPYPPAIPRGIMACSICWEVR
jgi:hypothetical protein